MTFAQAIVIGLLQGLTELFPVSSLGHSVILPALLGWTNVVPAQAAAESFFLAFLVGLHVATALALLFFFRADLANRARTHLLGPAAEDRKVGRAAGLASDYRHGPSGDC